jgi:multiple sugar transport system substrate-binding protein
MFFGKKGLLRGWRMLIRFIANSSQKTHDINRSGKIPERCERRQAMSKVTRREFLDKPAFIRRAFSEDKHAAYLNAKINWRQVEGTRIKVLVTPAHYFNKFRAITPQFEELSGVKIDFDIIPPREMREKAVLDFGAKSGNYATHTADPMYLSLYEANKWVEPLDNFLNNSKLTDKAWFDLDDIIPLWRAADSVKGKLYGMPAEGEATTRLPSMFTTASSMSKKALNRPRLLQNSWRPPKNLTK